MRGTTPQKDARGYAVGDTGRNGGDGRDAGARLGRRMWLLIAVLAASGLALALIVLLGLESSSSYSLISTVFVADAYLIASLFARHSWLRVSVWIGAVLVTALGLVVTFWPEGEYYRGENDPSFDYTDAVRTPYGLLSDGLSSLHIVVATLAVLCLFSLFWQRVRGERVLRWVYVGGMCSSGAAAVLWAVLSMMDSWEERDDRFAIAMSIVALTCVAIVVIAAFVLRGRVRAVGLSPSGIPMDQVPANQTVSLTPEQLRPVVRELLDELLAERADGSHGRSSGTGDPTA